MRVWGSQNATYGRSETMKFHNGYADLAGWGYAALRTHGPALVTRA